jgi:hypothetical protein
MKLQNPFPGMNPFLERHWPDVHTALIGYIRDALAEQLPPDLNARSEEKITLTDGEDVKGVRPDVTVLESWKLGIPPSWKPETERPVTTEPLVAVVEPEPMRWVQIQDQNGRLITVIEVLSPTNKDEGRPEYMQKRQTYQRAQVNIVEIDLLRGGRHTVAVPKDMLIREATYISCVCRGKMPGRYEYYPSKLQDPLPTLAIPLREGEADIALALQPLINRCYRMGSYWNTDTRTVPGPELPDAELQWVMQCLA